MSGAKVSQLRSVDVAKFQVGIRALLPVIGLLLLATTALSWGALGYALKSLESVWQDRVEALAELHETSAPFYRTLPSLSELGHPVAMDSAAAAMSQARAESSRAWKAYLGTTLTEAEVALVNRTTGPVAELQEGAAGIEQVLRAGDHAGLVSRMDSVFLPRLAAVAKRMEGLVALQQTVTRERVAEAQRRHQLARGLLIGSGVLAAVLMVVGFGSFRKRGSP
ncbi:MAG: Tar ligand binding domain-containing protein [Gemmatimonadaceae bacterium]